MSRSAAYAAQSAFHRSLRANAPQQLHQLGDYVKIDNAFGVVTNFCPDEVVHGNRGYYYVSLRDGKDLFGKPVVPGTVRRVLHSNVTAA